MSKGSKPRPCKVNRKQFEENWDKIFNKKKDVKQGDTNAPNCTTKL
jgi:hypothetical protein